MDRQHTSNSSGKFSGWGSSSSNYGTRPPNLGASPGGPLGSPTPQISRSDSPNPAKLKLAALQNGPESDADVWKDTTQLSSPVSGRITDACIQLIASHVHALKIIKQIREVLQPLEESATLDLVEVALSEAIEELSEVTSHGIDRYGNAIARGDGKDPTISLIFYIDTVKPEATEPLILAKVHAFRSSVLTPIKQIRRIDILQLQSKGIEYGQLLRSTNEINRSTNEIKTSTIRLLNDFFSQHQKKRHNTFPRDVGLDLQDKANLPTQERIGTVFFVSDDSRRTGRGQPSRKSFSSFRRPIHKPVWTNPHLGKGNEQIHISSEEPKFLTHVGATSPSLDPSPMKISPPETPSVSLVSSIEPGSIGEGNSNAGTPAGRPDQSYPAKKGNSKDVRGPLVVARSKRDDKDSPNISLAVIAAGNSSKCCYVTLDGNAYDVTSFLSKHPGGSDLILKYGGKDVGEAMANESSHTHSKAAYEILDESHVGYVKEMCTSGIPNTEPTIGESEPAARLETEAKVQPWVERVQVWARKMQPWAKESLTDDKLMHGPELSNDGMLSEDPTLSNDPVLSKDLRKVWLRRSVEIEKLLLKSAIAMASLAITILACQSMTKIPRDKTIIIGGMVVPHNATIFRVLWNPSTRSFFGTDSCLAKETELRFYRWMRCSQQIILHGNAWSIALLIFFTLYAGFDLLASVLETHGSSFVTSTVFCALRCVRFSLRIPTMARSRYYRFLEPPLEDGKNRIHWTCKCGLPLYDDFKEIRPGAAVKIEQELNKHALAAGDQVRKKRATSGDNLGERDGPSWLGGLARLIGLMKELGSDQSPSLPLHKGQDTRSQTTDSSVTLAPSENIFLLLCIPYRKHGTKLVHMDVATVNSDKLMFRELRKQYNTIRGQWTSLFSLQKLKRIRFVQFEVYKSELADIRKQNDIPPADKAHEYRYNPIPAETIPPVGENHIMHLYEHPEDAEEEGDCLEKFPKKLRERLLARPGRRKRVGWGIYFIEDIHWTRLWIVGFVGLLTSVLFGLCWSILRDDIQGGFGVTACMMVGLTFTVGIVQAAVKPK